MTDNELLLAISNIVETHVEPLKSGMEELKERIGGVEHRLDSVEHRLDSVELEQQRTNLTLENDIRPRLQTIEACYTSTYYRYADGIEELDRRKEDLAIVKKVVEEHSDQLKKIS